MTRVPTTPPTTPRSSQPSRPARPSAPIGVDPIRVLRQNIWLLVGTVVIGCVIGVGMNYLLTWAYPLYLGEVRFLLKPPLKEGMDVLAQELINEDTVVRLAQTEAARITGRETLTAALGNEDVRRTRWAQRYVDADGAFDTEEAVDDLIEEIRAGHRRGQQIFFISWRAHVPDDVPVVLNTVSETYMNMRRREDDRRFNQTSDVFRRQALSLEAQISDIKKQMNQFVTERGLTTTDPGGDRRRQEEVRRLMEQITEVRKDYDLIKSRHEHISKRLEGTLEPSPEDLRNAEDDPVLLNARRDLHDLKTHLAAAKLSFGPDHQTVRRLEGQVESAELNFRAKRDEIIQRNLRADYKDFSDRLDAIGRTLERQTEEYARRSKELETIASDINEINNMQERLKQLEEDRKGVLSKLNEIATVRARDDAARIEIVQRATVPREMDFPKLKVMIPVMALLTLAAVLVFLFTREFMDQRVRYTSDLAGLPGGRLLGVIPDAADDPSGVRSPDRAVRDHPDSVVAEAYRQTAVQIAKGLDAGHKVIEVLGPMPGGGTSTVVSNLAVVAKGMVAKVLVVDANFRRPELAGQMGARNDAPGLADLLAGNGTLAGSVQSVEGIDILGAGTAAHRIVERLASARLDEVLAEARKTYDVVLVDTPPAIVAGEVMTIANKVDATVLVVHAWHDQRGLIARLAHQLLDVRSVFLGVILNRPRSTAGGYFRKNAEAIAKYAKASR